MARKDKLHVEGDLEVSAPKGQTMAQRRKRNARSTSTGGTATSGGKKRRKRSKKAVKARTGKNAIPLPKKGTTLGGMIQWARQITHRVNQHHVAIGRIERACVTKGILSSTTKFTRLKGK